MRSLDEHLRLRAHVREARGRVVREARVVARQPQLEQQRAAHAGTELLKLLKSNEGPPKKKLLTEFIALCEQMGWMHWSVHYKDVQLKLFPAKLALL